MYGYVRGRPTYYEDPSGLIDFQIEFPNEIWQPYPDVVYPCSDCAPIIGGPPLIEFPIKTEPGFKVPGWARWPPKYSTGPMLLPSRFFPNGSTMECIIIGVPKVDFDPNDPFNPKFDFDGDGKIIIKF